MIVKTGKKCSEKNEDEERKKVKYVEFNSDMILSFSFFEKFIYIYITSIIVLVKELFSEFNI